MSIYYCDLDFKKPCCMCDEPRHIDDNFYVNYFKGSQGERNTCTLK